MVSDTIFDSCSFHWFQINNATNKPTSKEQPSKDADAVMLVLGAVVLVWFSDETVTTWIRAASWSPHVALPSYVTRNVVTPSAGFGMYREADPSTYRNQQGE
jgi:hypothetical protein